MDAQLSTTQVGPYSMNTYVVVDEATKTSVIIDPGGDTDKILGLAAGSLVSKILITHGHADHVMVLDEIRAVTNAPIYIHPEDAGTYDIKYDFPLSNGQVLQIGNTNLSVIHTPGHTNGQCCFDIGGNRIIVGDTLFVGGPGRTASPGDFTQTMETMKNIVFKWPDECQFFPGHGPNGKIGIERSKYDNYVASGWSDGTCGDVTW
jgi:glyoxylase-like metal-dependent hydrolase (beta-lactamase superfamily II)